MIWIQMGFIVSLVLNGAGLFLFLFYRRQIQAICRQIAFVRKEETNRLVTGELNYREIRELTREINLLREECRRLKQEYRKKDAGIKETIASLSHDIRTPLTSLKGYMELLEENRDPRDMQRYLEIIRGRIASLEEILDELFAYAKLQDESYQPELAEEAVSQIVFDGVVAFYEEFARAGIEPRLDLTEQAVTAVCNRTAFARVIQNVVKNSLLHSKSQVEISLKKEDGKVVFRCRNDVSAPEEIDMDQIFERFYRADSSRSRGSTGLGLSIAKGLMERMGGSMEAELAGDWFEVRVIL